MNPQNASRDQNDVATLLGVSNADARTPVVIYADPVTHRLLVDLGGGGGGTVTSVSVATAHGFSGTVANPTTAPVITLSATPVGILQSDGTSLSAISIGTGLTFTGGTLSASSGSGTVTSVALTMPTGFTVTGSPITTNGTFAVTTSLAGAVYASGGAFLSVALAQGDLLFGSATNTLSTLAKNTTATRYLSNTGTTNNPAWSQVNLTNGVTGLLPSANINITDLTSNTTFLSDIANSATFISDLTSNVTFQGDIVTIINNAGSSLTIDLATQVGTSILPLANGGTGADLTAPGADTLMGYDNTDGSVEFFTIGSGLNYDHSTHTLSSQGGTINGAGQSFLFDEFVGGSTTVTTATSATLLMGDLGWTTQINSGSGNFVNTQSGTSDHPGNVEILYNGTNLSVNALKLTGGFGALNTPSTIIEGSMFFSPSGTQAYLFYGLSSNITNATDAISAATAKIAFIADITSGNWIGYTSDGTTQHTTSGVAFGGAGVYDRLNISIDGTGANATFTVNGTLLGTIAIAAGATANAFMYFAGQNVTTASSSTATIDYFSFNRVLTR